ncbi:TldD/PmbA family protein [Lysinibacillus xylanilyticus]|uniref:TldD/PmbA family protein n=1 Tax=Lysinibacillus xylanilyticus TaxID=582475 RepID=A0A2M9Q611_9BACI|nr:TldD/PmbA family protein [Lysinibacillus xylanilyticus]PJO43412.1 hypothetical protein CWD94_12750 [Lysinibacillus xylanilyticus]
MLSKIQELSDSIKRLGVDYVHVFCEDKYEFFTEHYKSRLNENERNIRGISIIVYKDNKSGFAATNNLTDEGIQQMIVRALKKIDMETVSQKKNLDLNFCDLGYKFKHYHKEINPVNEFATKLLTSEVIRRTLISNNGDSPIEENIHYGSLISELEFSNHLFERCIGWGNYIDNVTPSIYKLNDEVSFIKNKYIQSVKINNGIYSMVFGNLAAGMLFHEIVHLFESRNNEFPLEKITNINKNLTIFSNPTRPGLFGSYKFDDEGRTSQEVCLVKNGEVKNLITNSLKNSNIDIDSNGHGRREDFRYRSYPRMSNVEILSGEVSFDKLLSHSNNSLYIQKIKAGNANHKTGIINLKVEEAFEIVDGEIGNPIKPFFISGSIEDFLSRLELIGDDPKAISISCKGSSGIIPVSLTQPSVFINALTIVSE